MLLKGRQVQSFLAQPDPEARAALIFGPDAGLVSERSAELARRIVPDPSDPFRAAVLTGTDLSNDPARLQDEAQALSMMGGSRLVLVRGARDEFADLVGALLDLERVEAFVIFEGGDLGPRSTLRLLFEAAPNAVAIACYADDPESLSDFAKSVLAEPGLKIQDDALAVLVQRLGTDRLLSRRSLEKLALYMGSGAGTVTIADVDACIGDHSASAFDDVVYAAASGDIAGLDAALKRAFLEGATAVGLLRTAASHIQKLQFAAGQMERGVDLDRAVKAVRPPVFFRRLTAFRSQARQWDTKRLGTALGVLTEAEMRCKSTGTPEAAVCERALWAIAAAARAGRRG